MAQQRNPYGDSFLDPNVMSGGIGPVDGSGGGGRSTQPVGPKVTMPGTETSATPGTDPSIPTKGPAGPTIQPWTMPGLNFDPVAIGHDVDPGFSYRQMPYFNDLMGSLQQIYKNGGNFNDAAVQRRISNADDSLRRFQRSQMETDKAALADRGLLGSGPEQTAYGRLAENVAGQYSNAVNEIYAHESELADQRLAMALHEATGLSIAEAQNYVDQFKTDTERVLGFANVNLGHETNAINQNKYLNEAKLGAGRLSLDNTLGQGALANQSRSIDNDYNLGADRNNISRDQLAQNDRFHNDDTLTKILELLNGTAGKPSNGYI